MIFLMIILVLLLLFLLYLMCIRPNSGRRDRLEPFETCYIAHRGLFDNEKIPENSLSAFRRAIDAGYGIELDVQLTADDYPVVFHDETLERMCGDERILHQLTYQELSELTLLATEEKIPLLEEVLELINGAVPLVVEIKSEGRYLKTSELTNEMLLRYQGIYCLESFHPMVLAWYRKNSPDTLRGQLATDFFKDREKLSRWLGFLLTNLLLNFLSRPDFIAYNHIHKQQISYRLCRMFFPTVNAAWTVRSPEQLEQSEDTFQIIIFDSFLPDTERKK